MKVIATIFVCAALCSAPAQAVTSIGAPPSGAKTDAKQHGVIEQVKPGSKLRISGQDYVFAMADTEIRSAAGARIAVPRLAPGQAVTFTVVADGSRQRIKQLWLSN